MPQIQQRPKRAATVAQRLAHTPGVREVTANPVTARVLVVFDPARLAVAALEQVIVLPQGPSAPPGLAVAELVEQGRFPHAGPWRMLRRQDHTAIDQALALTGMAALARRPLDALSGGESQRAWIALALAQATLVLLLDEPTTFLDIGHQLEVVELLRRLNQERGLTLVVVLHDLNHAARLADRLLVLRNGALYADGPPDKVLTPSLLEAVFGVRAHVLQDPISGAPVCLPYARLAPPVAVLDGKDIEVRHAPDRSVIPPGRA